MTRAIRIGNGQGFWGDDVDAPVRLAAAGRLDCLTLDYLAEVTMSILARQRARDPDAGYARDFVDVVARLCDVWREQPGLKVIANAGGLNPHGCARACADALRAGGCGRLRVGVVAGDDLMPSMDALLSSGESLAHLETGEPLAAVRDRLVTANVYLGAAPIVEALRRGADLVVTGRVADPSMVVAPAALHHGWAHDDHSPLAGATVAGHLIECGAQVTGGIFTHWDEIPDPANIGYPIVEVGADGACVVTKPDGTGGCVTLETVKEQLLYELGDPANYLSPDATVDFTTLSVAAIGTDRVAVCGATGRPPPPTYKVSATYHDGYRATGTLTLVAPGAVALGERCGEVIRERLRRAGLAPREFRAECLGGGGAAPGATTEIVLRVSAADPRREVVERFAREIAPLVTTGPQGVTGYAAGRPRVQEVFAYWPAIVARDRVTPTVHVEESDA